MSRAVGAGGGVLGPDPAQRVGVSALEGTAYAFVGGLH